MTAEAKNWIVVAHRLGIDTIAPFKVELSGVLVQFTALLPQFGPPAGMVIDADWDTIEPHKSSLLAAGYGFSCVEPPELDEEIDDMLSDWGWSSPLPKPDWLKT